MGTESGRTPKSGKDADECEEYANAHLAGDEPGNTSLADGDER